MKLRKYFLFSVYYCDYLFYVYIIVSKEQMFDVYLLMSGENNNGNWCASTHCWRSTYNLPKDSNRSGKTIQNYCTRFICNCVSSSITTNIREKWERLIKVFFGNEGTKKMIRNQFSCSFQSNCLISHSSCVAFGKLTKSLRLYILVILKETNIIVHIFV